LNSWQRGEGWQGGGKGREKSDRYIGHKLAIYRIYEDEKVARIPAIGGTEAARERERRRRRRGERERVAASEKKAEIGGRRGVKIKLPIKFLSLTRTLRANISGFPLLDRRGCGCGRAFFRGGDHAGATCPHVTPRERTRAETSSCKLR